MHRIFAIQDHLLFVHRSILISQNGEKKRRNALNFKNKIEYMQIKSASLERMEGVEILRDTRA